MKKESSGLTLLELILALFLFASIVPLFAGIWTLHHRSVKKNIGVIAGNHICHLVLEQTMAVGYDGVNALSETPLADRTMSLATTTIDNSGSVPVEREVSKDYVWSITVETPAEEPTLMAGEKLITVDVTWEDERKVGRAQLSTLLAAGP
jgi:hypothetical protein